MRGNSRPAENESGGVLIFDRLLKDKIHSTFDGVQPGKSLAGLCLKLLADQKETWPVLREGYEALRQVRERSIPCSGFSVLLQHNPGRIMSTLAAVGEQDTNERPCFLCLHHLPEGQKGVLYRDEYLILCNPMPVFSAHFTIAHIDHRPQSISGHVDTFLRLMADFGSSLDDPLQWTNMRRLRAGSFSFSGSPIRTDADRERNRE